MGQEGAPVAIRRKESNATLLFVSLKGILTSSDDQMGWCNVFAPSHFSVGANTLPQKDVPVENYNLKLWEHLKGRDR